MNPGVLSILCLTGLLILFWSGWFADLPSDLGMVRPAVAFGLMIAWLLAAADPVPLQSGIELHPGLLIPAMLWIHLLFTDSGRIRFKALNAGLLIGFFLFFWHEAAHVDAAWERGSWRLISVLCAGSAPLLAFDRLNRRMAAALGSLLLSHAWIVLFRRETLSPPVLGAAGFLDTVWITVSGLIVFHYGEELFRARLQKRRN